MTNHEIAVAIRELRRCCDVPVDPDRRGPVQLDRLFQAADLNVSHVSLFNLTIDCVRNYLVKERFVSSPSVLEDMPADMDRLEGLLFWSGSEGLAFVDSGAILSRRRFTAAHELGHAVLHRNRMGRYKADAKESQSIREGDDESDDEIEREANRFAAELLMPEELLRSRATELRHRTGCCPRSVLEYRLAAELLVSQQALSYRLKDLEVGDE